MSRLKLSTHFLPPLVFLYGWWLVTGSGEMEFLPPPLVLLAELDEDDELLPPLATGLEGEADTVRREAGELELRLYEPEA